VIQEASDPLLNPTKDIKHESGASPEDYAANATERR
jgi:hypothetical protein